jgi:hypothetical protein
MECHSCFTSAQEILTNISGDHYCITESQIFFQHYQECVSFDILSRNDRMSKVSSRKLHFVHKNYGMEGVSFVGK